MTTADKDAVHPYEVAGALRESEERLRLALAAGKQAPWEMNLITEEVVGSPELCEMFGAADASELARRADWRKFVLDEDTGRIQESIQRAAETNGEYFVEYRIRRGRDGAIRWIASNGRLYLDTNGKASRLVGIARDVTDSKRAEEARQANEKRLVLAMRGAQAGAWEMDLENGVNSWMQGMPELVGIPPERAGAEAQRWMEFVHPEDREGVKERFVRAAETSTPWEDECRIVRADGSVRWVAARGAVVASGSAKRMIGVAIDITQRKLAEAALRESEERYHSLFSNMNESFAIGEPIFDQRGCPVDFRFIEVNEAFHRSTGLGRESIGRPMKEVLPNLEPSWMETYIKVALTGEPVRFENYNRDTDRHYRVYCFSPSRSRFAILFNDISEERHIQEALRKSEEHLRLAMAAAKLGHWNYDSQHDRLYWSPQVRAVFGLKEDDPVSYHRFLHELLHPDERERVDRAVRTAVEAKRPYDLEYRVIWPDGSEHWVAAKGEAAYDESGNMTSMFGVAMDITDRKRREENLAFLAEIAAEFARLSSPQGIIQTMGEKVGAYLKVKTCNFAEVDNLRNRITVNCAWRDGDAPVLSESYRMTDYFKEEFIQACRRQETIVIRDTAEDLRTEAEGHHALGIGSFVAVPFHKNGEWVYLFSVTDAGPRDWREDEIELFQELAARIFPRLERARAEEALEASERRLRTFFESDMVGTIFWNIDGRITNANDKFLRMVGYSREETAAGRVSWAAMTPPEYRGRDARALEELKATGVDTAYEKEFIRKDGTRVPVILGAAMLDELRQEGIAFVLDITDRKRAEEALKEADRRKDQFMAMLAHELRNPMAAIGAAASLLLRPNLSPEKVELTKHALKQRVNQLARLVDDLLDVSRIARGKIELVKENVELEAVIARAVESSRGYFEEREQELIVQISDSLPAFGDPVRLEQIVTNLLTNASRYSDQGGQVMLRAFRDRDKAVIQVRDHGVGISPELLPKLFEPFIQGEETLARTRGGLGLGLAIVRSLCEMHYGSVSAKSEGEGKGSEFEVRLPIGEGYSISDKRKHAAGLAGGLRILLVEDHVDTALMQAAILELEGHTVELANDGLSAVERALSMKPEVILLDIGLPGLDGYEVAKRVRAAGLADTFIVALTGYGQERDIVRAHQAGIDHHLLKPVDYEKLVALLTQRHARKGETAFDA